MREKNGGARALTGQQALDEAEDLPDPLALSGDLVVIAHLPRAALPEQPERVGKRLREVGWRIRLAAAGREPNLRRGHPRKGRTAGRVGAVVPAAAASRRSNFRSRESGTFLDRVRDPALDSRASRGRGGWFPHASRSFQLSVRRSFTTEAVTSRPRLADRDLVERDLRDANFASPFPETQKATMTSTLAPARARQLCARSSMSTRKKRPEAFTVQVRRVQAKWRLVDCRPDHAAWLKFGTDPGCLRIEKLSQHPPQHFTHFPAKLGTHFPNFQLRVVIIIAAKIGPNRRDPPAGPFTMRANDDEFHHKRRGRAKPTFDRRQSQSQSQSAFLPSLRHVPVTTASLGSARGSSRGRPPRTPP